VHAVVIDLAALPGGVDDESAAALDVKVVHALALPGKEAPLTAGRYLRDTVYHLIMGV
jgi:dipicolinate synthase subunit A